MKAPRSPFREREPLTAERARELLAYNKRTGWLTWRVQRGKMLPGMRAGSPTHKNGYRIVWIDGLPYGEHRVAFLIVKGRWPKAMLDHKDKKPGAANANRWGNLREATPVQNLRNTGARSHNKSGLKWVRTKPSGFQATVQLSLGIFSTPEAAHRKAARFIRKHHGSFYNPGRSA